MPRVHGLLTTFLKYNNLTLYKGNLPRGFLGKRHKEKLSRLDLDSHEMRQLQHDLLYTYKIVFNMIDMIPYPTFQSFQNF